MGDMVEILIFCLILLPAAIAESISFAPPAPIRCADDPDMKEECGKFKEKKFCTTKVEIMELACAKTCDFCPKETFSKDISDIIKDEKKIAKATGEDPEKTKQGLKEGKGSPTAEGDFKGKGESDAEKEATEVPEKEDDGGDKGDNDNGGKKPDEEKGEGDKTKDVKEPDLEDEDVGEVGSTSALDEEDLDESSS